MQEKNKIQAFEVAPLDFMPKVFVAACYVEIEGKTLFLQYSDRKSEPGRWGVPAGKFEKDETPLAAAIRELFEETGIEIKESSQVVSLGQLFMRRPEIDYIYHLFAVIMNSIPPIQLSDEHQNFQWVTRDELNDLPLMTGAREGFVRYDSFDLFRM